MRLAEIQSGRKGFVPAAARAGLRPLSWLWALGSWLRNALFDAGLTRATRMAVPVISVGNIAAGGTGKTPFVIWLAGRLQEAGHRPGILARGYGDAAAGASGLNDEGAVIHAALGEGVPQVQDPDRVRGGHTLLAAHPSVDVLLLDDGFQHRRIARDLDIVLLDAMRPFGFGHLLPRGLLRERPSALRRAGAVVLTRTERATPDAVDAAVARVHEVTEAPVARARTRPLPGALYEELSGATVLACCGIGNPDAFLGTLADLGAKVVETRILRDHEALPPDGWPGLLAEARAAGAESIAITRKDAVKHDVIPAEVVIIDIETVVEDGADELWQLVLSVLR
jgi:tetraacyldisaccharide 4'-kinase